LEAGMSDYAADVGGGGGSYWDQLQRQATDPVAYSKQQGVPAPYGIPARATGDVDYNAAGQPIGVQGQAQVGGNPKAEQEWDTPVGPVKTQESAQGPTAWGGAGAYVDPATGQTMHGAEAAVSSGTAQASAQVGNTTFNADVQGPSAAI